MNIDPQTCRVGEPPANEDGYFEKLIWTVFQAGISWKVIEAKWDGFRQAFGDFSIAAVAEFDEQDIERLVEDKEIVRNYKKISATIKNAREMQSIIQEFGSFAGYLQEISAGGEAEMTKILSKRFAHLGPSTALFFLRSVGYEMPETVRKWAESR